ncbi:hypothetical protein RI367_000704 [Sorochytrium milnesiophthora]
MQRFEELMRQAEENQRLANREAERLKQRQEEDERRKREQSRRDRDERQQLEVKSRLAAVKAKQMERNMLRDMAASGQQKRSAQLQRRQQQQQQQKSGVLHLWALSDRTATISSGPEHAAAAKDFIQQAEII